MNMLRSRLLVSRWVEWAEQRPDSEHEQATWRVVIGAIAGLYLWSPLFAIHAPSSEAVNFIREGIVIFVAVSGLLLIHVLLRPGPNPGRRYLGMALDLGTSSLGMGLGGSGSIPLLVVYLWVIVGNGFRYGQRYLFAATLIALAGFGIAALFNDAWSSNPPLPFTIALVLLVIPAYSSSLLAKLNRAVKQARQASEAKSRFISNMSHELRTPLNGVIGSADLLGQTPLDPEQRELLNLLHGSAQTLLEPIEEVLDISKIEAGHIVIQRAPFDLHQLVTDTARLFSIPARTKGLKLELLIDPNIPAQVIGDAMHLRQVLTNLLSNAVKFTEQGSINIALDAVEVGSGGLRLLCTVSDTGLGIAHEALPHIFERFRQADSGTTRKYGGTGLGTAISRNLIELMDGHIGVESQAGKGSRFWFELPLRSDPQPATESIPLDEIWILADEANTVLLNKLLSGQVAAIKPVADKLPTHDSSRRVALIADLAMLENQSPDAEIPIIGLNSQTAPDYPPGLITLLPAHWSRPVLMNAVHIAATLYAHRPSSQAGEIDDEETRGENLTLLVAEDNAVNRRLLERILIMAGHRVELVEDGEVALDRLEEAPNAFDAVILDMNMPHRSGIDVAKALRFLHPEHHTPLIMLSADATTETIEESRRAGFDAYLTKPVEAKRLLKLLQDLHRQHPVEQAAAVAKKHIEQAPPLLDATVLNNLELLGTDRDFVAHLVQNFVEDGQPQLERMQEASNNRDSVALRDAAHALRGSAAELGCRRLTTLCSEAEHLQGFEFGSQQTSHLLEQIERTFELTRAELTRHLSEHEVASH